MIERGDAGTAVVYDSYSSYHKEYKHFSLSDFSGGICTDIPSSKKGQVKEMRNMRIRGRALQSMPGPQSYPGTVQPMNAKEGCYADGIWLFPGGDTLYAMKDGICSIVGTAGMLDSGGTTVYYVGGSFVVASGEKIYTVNRSLVCIQIEMKIPVCFREVSADGTSMTADEEINAFGRYIDIIFASESVPTRKVPAFLCVDPAYIRIWQDETGVELRDPDYNFDGTTITFFGIYSRRFRVRLCLADSLDDTKISFTSAAAIRALVAGSGKTESAVLAGKTIFFPYGAQRKNRMIAALPVENTDVFSYIHKSLFTYMDNREPVTAIIAYSDGFLVFSENTVKRMTVSVDETGEMQLSLAGFKSDFGSDMPDSVCGFDDKILFASSRGGICYIDRFGISEKDASRPISANIEAGIEGFFSHTAEEYGAASAICAFGRYFLTVGDMTYIWDYTSGVPSGTKNQAYEEKMVWSMSTVLLPERYLRQIGSYLYVVEKETGALLRQAKNGEGAVSSLIRTADCDFETNDSKVLMKISVRLRASGKVKLRLYYDGEASACEYTISPLDGEFCAVLKPYAHRFISCAAGLSSDEEFSLIAIDFIYL